MPMYQKRASIIGFDYGTHSTKVVHRIRDEELGRIVRFDIEHEGYPRNASPSVIREIDGRLYFGTKALQLQDGENYGSLKSDLLHSSGDDELDERIDVLTAAYLAWALGNIFRQDPQLVADDPVIQFSAPTSHVGNEVLVNRYLRIAHACYTTVRQCLISIEQGVEHEDVVRVIRPLLHKPVPHQGDRRFGVLPETIAPIVSLQLQPFVIPGIYLIADMGASTTEMSVFAVNDERNDHSILAYHDETDLQGGILLGEIAGMMVGPSQARLEQFLNVMQKQANRVWHSGFCYDKNNRAASQRWKSLHVMLTGGATHHPDVRKHFDKRINPIIAWPTNETLLQVGRHAPTTLRCDAGYEESDLSLFAVANGLSIQRPKWPPFVHSHQIAPLMAITHQEVELLPSYLEIG